MTVPHKRTAVVASVILHRAHSFCLGTNAFSCWATCSGWLVAFVQLVIASSGWSASSSRSYAACITSMVSSISFAQAA